MGRGFLSRYLRAISKAEVAFIPEKGKKSQTPVYSESDIEHPELFRHLKDWRSRKAKEQGLAHFQILHQRVLIQIVVNLPDNRTDLKKIKGVGKKTLEKYGEDILAHGGWLSPKTRDQNKPQHCIKNMTNFTNLVCQPHSGPSNLVRVETLARCWLLS